MTDIKVLIIDDEADGRNFLALLLKQYFPSFEIAGFARNVAEGLNQVELLKPNLVFLDIEMPDGNAFDILSAHSGSQINFILVTAYEKYALKALKVAVADYLLKPVSREEFNTAVNKVITRIGENAVPDYSNLLNDVQKQIVIRKIRIPTSNGFMLVAIDEIIRCEASGNYTKVYFMDRTHTLASRSLGEYENDLRSYGFIRIHNKHVVNINQILEYNKGGKGGGYIVMNGRETLEVSARRKTDLLRSLE